MSAIDPAAADYIRSFGLDVPATYEELPENVVLALSFKADYESTYGDESGWDEVPGAVSMVIPDRTVLAVQRYCVATRAGTGDLLEEGERWLRKRGTARALNRS